MSKIEELLEQLDKVQDDLKIGGRKKYKRGVQTREIVADTDRLYGSLDKAIAYLQEIKAQQPTAGLEEKWTDYEDMYMRFSWITDETDEEYTLRLELRLYDEKCWRKDREERKRKDAIREQIKELQKRL